ncbi:MAG: hypothetical protein KC636_32545 [Myxococcales bacterium]|nr:hypothetical protein [Myxococcales bacterium]
MIIDENPDAPEDYDEFTVTGDLRIDDVISDNALDMGLNNACMLGDGFTSITGVHGWSFDNRKLQPRFEADVAWIDCNPFSP